MNSKFEKSKHDLKSNLSGIEKYIEEVHNQQIADYERLKKIATDAALGIGFGNPSATMEDLKLDKQMSSIAKREKFGRQKTIGGRTVKDEDNIQHAKCTYDYLLLTKE